MTEINWHTGNPSKSGIYLTTRKSRLPKGKTYIAFNQWIGLDWPGNKTPRWLAEALDNSVTIAWASEKDVQPYQNNKEDEK